MAVYGTRLTSFGKAAAEAAIAGGQSFNVTSFAVGDGDWGEDKPDDLVNELYRSSVVTVTFDESIADGYIFEAVIPIGVGGFTIKEVSWILDTGEVFAMTKYPPSYKSELTEGSGGDFRIRVRVVVGDASVVNVTVDPSLVMADRKYVDDLYIGLAQQLASIPKSYLVTSPVVTGDPLIAYGGTVSLSASGSVSAFDATDENAQIKNYVWTLPGGEVVEGDTVSYQALGEIGDYLKFDVSAVDDLGYFSDTVEFDVEIIGARPVNLDGLIHTLPDVVVSNQVVNVSFSGAVDPDNDDAEIRYNIIDMTNVTASKTTDIVANELVEFQFLNMATDTTAEIVISAVGLAGVESEPVTITAELYSKPILYKPANTYPYDNMSDVTAMPVIRLTQFTAYPEGSVAAESVVVVIATNSSMSDVVYTNEFYIDDEFRVDQRLPLDTVLWFQTAYRASDGRLTPMSTPTKFTTVVAEVGAVLDDGAIIVGRIRNDWIAVSTSSNWTMKKWGLFNHGLPEMAALSQYGLDPNTGSVNTDYLMSLNSYVDPYGVVGCPAAIHCRSIGYDLPNINELEMVFSQKALIDELDSDGAMQLSPLSVNDYFWSSTRSGYTSSAWTIAAKNVNPGTNHRNSSQLVIPCRRVPV